MNIQHTESIIGRPAKPGETPTKKGIPVTTRRGTGPITKGRPPTGPSGN